MLKLAKEIGNKDRGRKKIRGKVIMYIFNLKVKNIKIRKF